MKIKPNELAMTAFSKHFKRIFGGETTFGEIQKIKQNSTENLMGSHVEQHLKDQQEYLNKLTKETHG